MNKNNIHMYIYIHMHICLYMLIYVYKIPMHLTGPGLRLLQPVWSLPQDLAGRAAKIAAGEGGHSAGDCCRQTRVAGHTGVSVAVASGAGTAARAAGVVYRVRPKTSQTQMFENRHSMNLFGRGTSALGVSTSDAAMLQEVRSRF